ncbi:hypothetical protein IW261DRAFT_1575530 [Armillaria novae-zelandiae]|uniref:Uncharacterized protein n=1 Tax=Armillaria novae-zelandiae TaxID=153914 RepID=A0AA39NE76_9AGAR|nr:hypothetical protein IW261DRAFT_1575530 [Armillaria novae-zelandiae]
MGHPITSALALTLPPPLPPLSLSPLPQPLSLPPNTLTRCQCDKGISRDRDFLGSPGDSFQHHARRYGVLGVGSLHLNLPNNTF